MVALFKKDIFYILLLTFIIFISLTLLRGYFGDAIIACGRELHLPQAMLDGNILFKDIFGMYNPLGYQINTLLYLLFGNSITTLQFAGIVNSYFILIAIYCISRCFLESIYSFAISMVLFLHYICFSSGWSLRKN